MGRVTWRRALAAIWCGSALLLSLAPQGHAGARRGDAVDALLDAPEGAQLIVSIDEAGELAHGPLGQAGLAMLEHVAPDLPAAWGRLAKQLGMSEQETFDRLFGRRVLIASKRDANRSWSWVVRCIVDDETAQALRRSIVEAPRKLVNGRQVLAAEGGRFELVVVDLRKGRAAVLLGPADHPELLDAAALGRPHGGGMLMPADPRERQVDLLPRGTRIFLYSSLNESLLPGLGDLAGDCASWTALAAAPDEQAGSLKFTFVTMVEDRPERLLDVKPWSKDTFESFAHGALFAVVESDVLSRELWPTIEQRFMAGLEHPIETPDHGAFGGRVALGVYPSPTGPIDFVVGLETPDVGALAPAGDRFMAGIVGLLPGLGGSAANDFGGMAPDALREVDLRPAIGNAAVMGWPDVGPTLAWRFPRAPEGVEHGWMTAGLGGELVDQTADALAGPEEGARQAWLSMGVIRPAALVNALAEFPMPQPAWFGTVRSVDALSWEVMAGPGGALVGSGELRLSAPPAR